MRAYAHGAHDGSFRACPCGSAGRARHMGSVCVRSREPRDGTDGGVFDSRSGCLERERRARRRAGYQSECKSNNPRTPRLAHKPRLDPQGECVRCDGPSRHRQCGHSASCDDYRRTSTTRRSLQHRAARHHTLHRQDSLGRTHAPVQRNRRYREARPKPRTMCCGRCHATRAAGPGAGRDD